ncbi:MAG: tetratricopeptide repeat protein [Candidatus Delongbacteria bacterium]
MDTEENNDLNELRKELEKLGERLDKDASRNERNKLYAIILAAIIAAIVSVFTTFIANDTILEIEETKFKQNSIKEIITSSDISESRKKLLFLLDSKIIEDEDSQIRKSLGNLRDVSKGFKLYIEANDYLDSAMKIESDNRKIKLFNEATYKLTESIEYDPYSDISYRDRGFCYFHIGIIVEDPLVKKYSILEAISDYNAAMKISPNNSNYYYLRGLAYHNLPDWEKAKDDYDKSIEIDDIGVEPNYFRGVIAFQDGDSILAARLIKRAFELNYERAKELIHGELNSSQKAKDMQLYKFLSNYVK